MPVTIIGSGTLAGLTPGGLPDGVITNPDLAADAVSRSKLDADTATGVCKAWVNFNGTGTVAIRAAYNVSSITDNGTGDYTVNFATAMVDANYNYALSTRHQNGVSRGIVVGSANSTPAAGSFRIEAYDLVTGAFSLKDVDYVNVAIFR